MRLTVPTPPFLSFSYFSLFVIQSVFLVAVCLLCPSSFSPLVLCNRCSLGLLCPPVLSSKHDARSLACSRSPRCSYVPSPSPLLCNQVSFSFTFSFCSPPSFFYFKQLLLLSLRLLTSYTPHLSVLHLHYHRHHRRVCFLCRCVNCMGVLQRSTHHT